MSPHLSAVTPPARAFVTGSKPSAPPSHPPGPRLHPQPAHRTAATRGGGVRLLVIRTA
jgi:hypothetical protein